MNGSAHAMVYIPMALSRMSLNNSLTILTDGAYTNPAKKPMNMERDTQVLGGNTPYNVLRNPEIINPIPMMNPVPNLSAKTPPINWAMI
jgi:hypothetical protein